MGIDDVTGRYQPRYPKWKTNLKASNLFIIKNVDLNYIFIHNQFLIYLFSDVLRVIADSFSMFNRSIFFYAFFILYGKYDY